MPVASHARRAMTRTYFTPSTSPEMRTRLPSISGQEFRYGSVSSTTDAYPDDTEDGDSDSVTAVSYTEIMSDEKLKQEFKEENHNIPNPLAIRPLDPAVSGSSGALPPIRGLIEQVDLMAQRQDQERKWHVEQAEEQRRREQAQQERERIMGEQQRFNQHHQHQGQGQGQEYTYEYHQYGSMRRPLPSSGSPSRRQRSPQVTAPKKPRAPPRNLTGEPRVNKKYSTEQTDFLLYWKCDHKMGWEHLVPFYNRSFPGENRTKSGIQGRLYRQNLVLPRMDANNMLLFDENDEVMTYEMRLREQGEEKFGLLRRTPYKAIRYPWVYESEKAPIRAWALAQQRQLDEAAMRRQRRKEFGDQLR